MKVCLVSSCWVPTPPLRGGAIEAQVYGLAKTLTRYCEEIHIVTILGEDTDEAAEYDNLRIHKIKMPVENPASSGVVNLARCEVSFARKASEITKKLGVNLIHYNTPYPCLFGLRMVKEIPKIYHAHNWRAIENPRFSWLNPAKKLIHEVGVRVDKHNARHVEKIATISNFMKRGVERTAHVDESKVPVVPNSVDVGTFYHDDEGEGRDKSILFVGRLFPEKGLDYLVKAMPPILHEIPDVKLVVVGPERFGVEKAGFKRYLDHLIRSLDLTKHVKFRGRIPVNELRYLYSKAGVFILPAVWAEPFGVVFIEAMACETPVIGTNVGGIPEIIKERDVGILVEPKDIEGLAKAIITILSDEKSARRMGLNGRELVEQFYTWDVNAKKVYEVYEEVLGGI